MIAAPAFGFKQADLDKLKSGKRCWECDFTKANLNGAQLSGYDLSGSDLSRADLSKADLSRAFLRQADLRGAVLRGANLDFAILIDAKFCNTVMPNGDASLEMKTSSLILMNLNQIP